jgi:hypothetical protein
VTTSLPNEPKVSIRTTVLLVVFAVNGEIVTIAGSALRIGVLATATVAARIVILEISPIER